MLAKQSQSVKVVWSESYGQYVATVSDGNGTQAVAYQKPNDARW